MATTHPKSIERNLIPIARWLIAGVMLAAIVPSVRGGSIGGSIFDDDYTPPAKRVEPATPPAPSPPTPSETPAPAAPSRTPAPAVPVNPAPRPAPQAPTVHRGVPDRASRTKCRKLFEEIYAKGLKDRSSGARRKLAQTLLDDADKTDAGSPDRFVLLNGAIQAAEESRDLDIGFCAAELLASGYDVDELATKAEAVKKTFASASAVSVAEGNIQAILSLLDQLVDADDFDAAVPVEAALQRASPGISDGNLKTEVRNRIREMATLREARQKFLSGEEKLNKSPDDPAALLVVGSYLCFQRGQWDKGLPMLAKSNDAQLKNLAAAELAHPTEVDAEIKIGDGWFAVAMNHPASSRSKTMRHAVDLYRAAEVGVAGLEKLAIGKRLAQIPAALRPVDLLKLFDPATCIVKGVWRMENGSLLSEPDEVGRIEFPYEPPAEYDFRISFTILGAENGVAQICYASGHQFIYELGEYGNSISSFAAVNGNPANSNKTVVKKDHWLSRGRRYTSVVKVRMTGVEAYLDGQLVTSLKTNYSNVSLNAYWHLSHGNVVGFAATSDTVRFDTVEIVEISGEGKLLSK